MNTTEKGDKFEDKVLKLLLKDINDFKTFVNPTNHIKVFQKKKYYSRFRKANIEFDIAIEVYQDKSLPNYSWLLLIECKDYKKAVGVDQINKFLHDIRDLAEGNYTNTIKPIMAVSSRLAKSAYNIALERNVGLIKINESDELKWELNRNFKQYGINQNLDAESILIHGFNPEHHISNWFFYAYSKWFNGFREYLQFITGQQKSVHNVRIKYYSRDTLEDIARKILFKIGYLDGAINLSNLLSYNELRNVKLYENFIASTHEVNLLGKVNLDTNEIFIYKKEIENEKRDRFTLVHEISHILLGHSKYLDKDTLEESELVYQKPLDDSMIANLEFQANYLAGCLLVSKMQFLSKFNEIYSKSGLKQRSKHLIYLDSQPENKMRANNIFVRLSRHFNVSKSVIRFRLIDYGLLYEEKSIKNILSK